MSIQPGRLTVDNQQSLVVFLVGARINKWWLLPLSLPILIKMQSMLNELKKDPDSGFLGMMGGGAVSIQYWKSVEHLEAYALDREKTHKPTWALYFKKLFTNQAIGIWHETYLVEGGNYESIYTNMPAHGLGTIKPLISAEGPRKTLRKRLKMPASG